jgi:hypothetical protein
LVLAAVRTDDPVGRGGWLLAAVARFHFTEAHLHFAEAHLHKAEAPLHKA